MPNATNISLVDHQDDFIVINKPAGVGFHDEDCLGSGLFSQVKKTFNFNELYPVHRLDKMTSGLILFAKNLTTARSFQALFAQHRVEKYYLALSDKKPKKKQGLIKGDMAKSRRGGWKILRSENNPAISQFFSYGLGNGLRLFIVKPHSGKTHQIRVALNSIGSPIIGDSSYYPASLADRGYLHAYALRFMLNEKHYHYVNAPVEGEFFLAAEVATSITKLALPWDLPWPTVTVHN